MKIKLLLIIPLFIVLQVGGCSSDDDGGSVDGTSDNFISFLGETNDASGGCNVQVDEGLDISCSYSAFYQLDGLSYTIAVTHDGVCRTGTFNLSDDLDEPSDVFFVVQVASDGVAIDTYLGFSGTVDLVDSGISSNMSFDGTVVNTNTGVEEAISGFIQCPL